MLLAISTWVFPQPVQAKTKTASLPEAIQIKQEVSTSTNDQPILNKLAQQANPRIHPKAKVNSYNVKPSGKSFSGRSYSKEEVQALIIQYSEQYNINPAVPLCIAQKESGYNQFSANKSSSARGVFQYLSGTWRATDEGRAGLSVFDAEANVRAAIKYMASRKSTKPWTVGKLCPSL